MAVVSRQDIPIYKTCCYLTKKITEMLILQGLQLSDLKIAGMLATAKFHSFFELIKQQVYSFIIHVVKVLIAQRL